VEAVPLLECGEPLHASSPIPRPGQTAGCEPAKREGDRPEDGRERYAPSLNPSEDRPYPRRKSAEAACRRDLEHPSRRSNCHVNYVAE
jgi:hypothetical protein